MSALFGFIAALTFGGAGGLLSLLRTKYNYAAGVFVSNFLVTGVVVFFTDWLWVFYHRPAMIAPGLIALAFTNVFIMFVVAAIVDGFAGSFGAATGVGIIALIAVLVVWVGGYSSGHGDTVPCPAGDSTAGVHHVCSKAAYGLVHVDEHPGNQLPASTTSNLVIVTPAMARVKASNAMSYGVAQSHNYSSYLDLGPATLQMVDGHMWYVFPLEFQGAINKSRLNKGTKGLASEPGYIMVSGEDPGANLIERYNGQYSMVVSLGGGQGSEPDRWARNHGYRTYVLDDPTLEIADNGDPYYTVTLLKPQLGWTFPAPVGVLLINAHTGQITRYNLPGRGLKNSVPNWVDRVYSANEAKLIAGWYGFYSHAPFGGQGNSNRYRVSANPIMVYTGDGNPSWRMELTSYGNETSVSHIIEMDAATGAMQIYAPQQPMGIESTVGEAFATGTGVGAGQIKNNHLTAANLSLHVIYGHLTWMVSYEPQGKSPSFTGVGFVDAYNVSASNVAFGSTRGAALQNYLQELTVEQTANGAQPGAGGKSTTVSGTIASIRTDVSGGNESYYVTLNGKGGKPDYSRVYTGSSQLGSAIVEANPGDHVIIRVLKINKNDATQLMQSFTDQQHPLVPAGS